MTIQDRNWYVGLGGIVAWIFAVTLIACVMAFASPARAWGLAEVNKVIDETNFVVSGGCSGTLISVTERHILTAEHCVNTLTAFIEEDEIQPDGTVNKVKRSYRKPLEVTQSVLDEDGNIIGTHVYRAKLVKVLAKNDLALIQTMGPVIAKQAAVVLPATADMQRGETAYIVGNPLGLESTVTKGVISHIKRELPGASGIENDVKFTQLDGGAAPGNSGGGVFNESGQLIGVLVRGVNGANFLSFAVDIDDIRAFLAPADKSKGPTHGQGQGTKEEGGARSN